MRGWKQWMVVGCLAAVGLVGQEAPVEPGFRAHETAAELKFNPFEPITDLRADANSEASVAMLKRIKGYVVQGNGSPLLVIDGKSYRVRDKVPMNAAAKRAEGEEAAPVGGDTATILSITANEAVFQKDDASGFGGETFKVFFNFGQGKDSDGNTNYNVWEPAGNGFFINEEGIVVVPLAIAQSGELSVMTPYGYSKATLVESDAKRGIGLLKVNIKSIPLYLAERKLQTADAVFPAGFPAGLRPGKDPQVKFVEGFVREQVTVGWKISPEVGANLLGAAVLNSSAEVVGVLVGDTETLETVVPLGAQDPIFRKYAPAVRPAGKPKATRATIEQSIVQIYKKR